MVPVLSLPVLLATVVSLFTAGSVFFWTREPLATDGDDTPHDPR